MRTRWTDDKIEAALMPIVEGLGCFPSRSDLETFGRSDLANAVSKRGGYFVWSDRMGVPRRHSDSDTGWHAEDALAEKWRRMGLDVKVRDGVKCPYDLIVSNVLRVDVKGARYAEYGACKGWFYRIGKHPQADVIAPYQIDTGDFYAIPWWACPTTNITIARDGGKYADYLNNYGVLSNMIAARKAERMIPAAVA